jgi:hypothetical protein
VDDEDGDGDNVWAYDHKNNGNNVVTVRINNRLLSINKRVVTTHEHVAGRIKDSKHGEV